MNEVKNTSIKIAGNKTILEWNIVEKKIKADRENSDLWEQAFLYFEERINTRYLIPINSIKENDSFSGEGFSIVVILCSLIEALESFYQGKFYRKPPKKGEPNNPNRHYFASGKVFVSFLESKEPFRSSFNQKNKLAEDFYENVRCAILHEAATRNNWRIRANTNELIKIDNEDKILNRNIFINYISDYMCIYKNELFESKELKENFIRKMRSICDAS